MEKFEDTLDAMASLTVRLVQYIELKRVPYAIKDQAIRSVSMGGSCFAEAHYTDSKAETAENLLKSVRNFNEALYWLDIVERLSGKNEESKSLTLDIRKMSEEVREWSN